MITSINESETLTKHGSCKYKCKFDRIKCNSIQWWNNGKCRCECEKIRVFERDYVYNPTTFNCENGKYFASIMDKIICDKIIDIKETNFNEKNITCKIQIFFIILIFLESPLHY